MLCGAGFIVLHGREWSNLIAEGLTLPMFPKVPGHEAASEFVNVSKTVPQFGATFFGLTGMHMLHVTLGVIYLGVVALRRKFIPILLVLDRKSTRLNSSHRCISYAVFCLKK